MVYLGLICTVLSIAGAVLISFPRQQLYGFMVWVLSNIGWIIYYYSNKDLSPMILFSFYLLTSLNGCIRIYLKDNKNKGD